MKVSIYHSAGANASIKIAVSYLKDPPASYQFPAYDIPAAFEEIISNVKSGLYANEYEFQADLYAAFNLAKDGHFRYIPDLIGAALQFRRQDIALASVSLDGVAVPQIYAVCKYTYTFNLVKISRQSCVLILRQPIFGPTTTARLRTRLQ